MTKRKLNKQIAEDAAHWAVTLDAGPLSHADRLELIDWLKASPVHLDEFLMAMSLFEGAGVADLEKSMVIGEILAEISAADGEVIALGAGERQALSADEDDEVARDAPSRRAWWWGGAAAAAAALFLVVFGALQFMPTPIDPAADDMVVATALGEQRSVTLEDGSIVYVNTQSAIRVRYTDAVRLVELERGEALFEVEKDPARPFRVVAGDTVAEAIGTTFNVRFIDNEAEVSVVEGTVAFSKAGLDFATLDEGDRTIGEIDAGAVASLGRVEDGQMILSAGTKIAMAQTEIAPRLETANADAVTAWTVRKVVFNEDDLSTIAEEFNRYNRQRLVVVGDELGRLRFSGTFAADDPESFVAFLELTTDIDALETDREIRLRNDR